MADTLWGAYHDPHLLMFTSCVTPRVERGQDQDLYLTNRKVSLNMANVAGHT